MIGSGFERRSESNASSPEATAPGPRMRVYELAKELGLANADLVSRIQALGIDAANHMSHLESMDADRVRRSLTRERHESLVEERLTDTVIRRRSKVPPAAPAPAAPVPASAGVSAPRKTVAAPVETKAPAASPAAAPAETRRQVVATTGSARSPIVAKEPTGAVEAVSEPAPARRASRVSSAEQPATEVAPAAAAPPTVSAHQATSGMSGTSDSVAQTPAPAIAISGAEASPAPATAKAPSSVAPPSAVPTDSAAAPTVVLRTIPQPVVTGSAATGQFIQLPGRTPPGVPKVEIKDRDEELRRMGRAPVGRDRFGRPLGGAGPGGQRPGQPGPWAPKKKVAAAGKKSKKTEITTPAEHKRVVRMGDTIQVSEFAQKMGIKDGREHQP